MSSETKLALVQPQTAFPSEGEFRMLERIADVAIKSGYLPQSIRKPEQAIAIALKAREIGVPPMQGFAHIFIVDGKPGLSAELMMALVQRNVPGAQIVIDSTNDYCRIAGKRPNGSAMKAKFTMEDAKRAGLLNKGNWRSYPRAMLRARAISELCRGLFPDALGGCGHTPEELNPDLKVSEEGTVVELPTENKAQVLNSKPADGEVVQSIQSIQSTPNALSGPLLCHLCKYEMKLSQSGLHWFCPNFKDESQGKHSICTKDKADEHRKNQQKREEESEQDSFENFEG